MRTDDGSIIYECLNGEPGAFGVLVDKYKEGIYAYVYDKLRDFRDAQDVTQEVFLQAYRGLRSLRRWESFSFWLYRIASTRCKLWIRTQSRRIDQDFIADQDPKVLEDLSMDSYRGNQLSESVGEALDSLPDTYREALMLYYFAGMNSVDIARALGTSPTAIRHRLSRARARLKEDMVAMMDTAFEEQRLPSGFTFRVVEAVKHIKIHPMPRVTGLPWGLSLAVGVVITVLSLNPQMSITRNMAIPTGSSLPVETRVLKTGEIPVDMLKTSEISVIASKKGDGDGGAPQNAFMLAPQQEEGGKWTKKADMPTARAYHSTCVVDGKIYAIGGTIHFDPHRLSTAVEYDPKTDTWTKKADMPTARFLDDSVSAVNGKIYAIGGWAPGGRALSIVEEYDPKTDKWTRKADMPTPRGHFSTCAVNGKIYAIGGCGDQHLPIESTVEEYDPETDTWTKKADMPTARAGLGTAAVNGRIYAIGGLKRDLAVGNQLSTVEEYDPTTDTWIKKADMPHAKNSFAICAVNGKIYVLGGFPPLVVGRSVQEYNPDTDTWRELADMSTIRWEFSASAVDGKLYAIGGSNNVVAISTVTEYTPEDWQSISPQGKLPTKWGEMKQ